ncbi:uncharacterized protein A1O9_10850 [Exophiala aquamarina CBS 119918]|uniref:Uncharacterized protein n=1 Tax=Exophiala aquamarina CBS 119918 TaxID=1182545 RepID=A0A072NYK3_9EURO|nr:uncharacterized protein A1O9_10850 [Exophiala aquamarina CBS 119918]KEF52944.1 hypothetical protein A1O9_10850 [Exophiala aquamarina CBS 119918]
MLYKAIDKRKANAVELLIDLGVNVNQLSSKTDSKDPVYLPLAFAARRGNEAIVKLLIGRGADIHARDHFGNNALLSAASAGRDKIIELLLNAPHNADIEVQRMGEGDRKGYTPLMMAVYSGQLSSIRLLLDRGSNREAVNEAGEPLLHIAATMGKLPTIEFLLQNGSQVITINDKTGDTALHCAVRNESLRAATFLIQKGPLLLDVENKKKQTPLALAVKLKKREMVNLLIEKGAKTDLGDDDWRTPLHNAVIAKDSEMIRLLVERGTKVESLDKAGRTPLYHAVRTEDPAIVAMLLLSGYKMDVKNRSGRYPLQYVMEMPPAKESRAVSLLGEFLKVHEKGTTFHNDYHALPVAARKGKLQFVKDMLNNDPELVRWRPAAISGFLPPIHEAVKAGKEEVVKELCASRSYTLNPNARDRQGNTALHQAILNNQISLISLLIEKGADKELLTGQAEGALPPLHLAAREQNKKAVEALLQIGADCKRRVTNVAPCEKCRALRWTPTGGNARCILINLEPRLRKPDFQELDRLLFNAVNARN